MAARELTFKVNIDPAVATAEFKRFTASVVAGTNEVTKVARQQQQAVIQLQRQRSAALIAEFKREEREAQRTEAAKLREFQKGVAQAAREEQKRVNEAVRTANQRLREEQRAAREIAKITAETARQAVAQERIRERAAKSLADVQVREARRAALEIERTLREQQRQAAAASAASASPRSSSLLAGAVGGVTALVGVSAVSEIREAAAAWLDYSSNLENTRIAFTTMLGSAQAAEQHLKELQQFALTTPFQFSELIAASQRMQALGFNAEQVIPVLNDVGNAVAGAGGGSERLDRVVLALSQIQSKGKVMTQELNQLAEAGIPAFRILQETLHKTRSEVNELVEDGKISSKVFLDAFQKFSQQNFGGLMEQQSKTFTGALSNIKDALLQTSATAFEPLYEKLSQLARSFSETATSSKDFQEKLKTVGRVTATIFDGLVEAVRAIRDAIRIAVASITGQIEAIVHGLAAIEFAAVAVITRGAAMGRQLRGDLKGAAELSARANLAMAEALREAERAFTASGAAARKVVQVYNEAEEAAKRLANAQQKVGGDVGGLTPGILGKPRTTDTSEVPTSTKPKGADPAIAEKRLAEISLANSIAELNAEEVALKRSLARRETDFEGYSLKIQLLESARSARVIAGLIAEAAAAEKLRNGQQKTIALAEIEGKRLQEKARHEGVLNELEDRRFEITDRINEAIARQGKAIAELNVKTSSWISDVNDLIASLAKQGAALSASQEFWLRFNAQIAASIDRMRQLIPLLRESAEAVPAPGGGRQVSEKPPLINAGTPPPLPIDATIDAAIAAQGAFAGLGVAIADSIGLSQAAAGAIGDSLTVAFQGLAQAIGDALHAWVLFGSAGGSFKKFAAEVLASIAQMAVVQAVFELAQGLAMTALTWFTGNPKYAASAGFHYASAAAYGAIAGIAAVAGRSVAGDTFKQPGAGAGGSGFSADSGSPQQIAPASLARNAGSPPTPATQRVIVEIQGKGEEMKMFSIKAVDENFRNGGVLRETFNNDGGI